MLVLKSLGFPSFLWSHYRQELDRVLLRPQATQPYWLSCLTWPNALCVDK
jgi:hypothetical protein